MESFIIGDLQINPCKEGAREFSKVSYPLRYGRFGEIITPEYIFQFNLNGEIKFISGRSKAWPDPSEWLKRTASNDWIYYSTGGYSGVYDSYGEYYLPCPSYPSNSINLSDPFTDEVVRSAIDSWQQMHKTISSLNSAYLPDVLKRFLDLVIKRSPENLELKTHRLHEILGDRITVLPPDTRHVDYEVIPVITADGCLYKCGFCRVKTKRDFSVRSRENIKNQIMNLRKFYGHDIKNYNSIFMGQHDALNAGASIIEFAAETAYKEFAFERSNLKGPGLFLFGSVDSFIKANYTFFDRLDMMPFSLYINIGLESADRETLEKLNKTITPESVNDAFAKILEINKMYENIEVTANFVFGKDLPEGHLPAFARLMEKQLDHYTAKGAIYFSPMLKGINKTKRGIKREFYKIKTMSRLPIFLYLIQRL
jgi:hypothetical protein